MPSRLAVWLLFQPVEIERGQDVLPLHVGQRTGMKAPAGGRGTSPVSPAVASCESVRSSCSMYSPRGQHHGPFDDVLQFAHVARPAILASAAPWPRA